MHALCSSSSFPNDSFLNKDEYAKAEPFFLRVRELEPDNPHKWASRLSTVYYILEDKAKQAEMDKLLE